MNFIIKTLKENTMLIYCLQTQIVKLVKLKQIMFMKTFIGIKICLTLVIIHKIESFLILSIKKLLIK